MFEYRVMHDQTLTYVRSMLRSLFLNHLLFG